MDLTPGASLLAGLVNPLTVENSPNSLPESLFA